MNDAAQTDTLQEQFAREYPEKLFYFCLKRTGDPHEAEDLASDVTLHVLTALGRGVRPEHFPAWVWQIAHNRYCAWAKEKRRRADALAPEFPDGETDLSDPEPTPEETLLHAEALRLLRRELAFTSADYRHIVVAYYFDGVRLSEIADRLGLPDGTVRSKLHRARNLLKEGMKMERTFEKRSYQPEEIFFTASGYQPSGLPWRAIQRKIPKNILCAAHNNPCTLEELAIELGVALPYIEEEAQLLLDAELLRKTEDGKLLTNFLILSKDVQETCNELCCAFTEQQYETLWAVAGECVRIAEETNVPFGTYPPEDVRMYFGQMLLQTLLRRFYTLPYHRADGGNWGVVGFELNAFCRLPQTAFSNNLSDYRSDKVPLTWWEGYQVANWSDKVFCQTRYTQDVPNSYCLPLLRAVAEGADPATFSAVEREQVELLLQQGFLVRREDGSLLVDAIVVSRKEQGDRLAKALLELPAYASLDKAAAELKDRVRDALLPLAGKYFRDELDYYTTIAALTTGKTMFRLWKDRGLYHGASSRFCSLELHG